MRVISQDGLYDVPYEKYLFGILNKKIVLFHETAGVIVIATYSTKEKVEKAFKKMNKCYQIYISNITRFNGVVTICNNLTISQIDSIYEQLQECSVFQFPQDDEV